VRILIAEDEPVSRRLVEATLTKWGYDVVAARDGSEAWQHLQADDAPQLAVIDWMMPGMDGVQICHEVRKLAREPYTYIILLTGKNTQEDLIQGLEAGADDYLAKPFDPQELKVRLRAGKRILDLQAELITAREALRVQATHDALTGLWNRAAVLDLVRRELERARREWTPLAVFMVDLDHFKRINDTHGHAAGDAVLRQVAEVLRTSIRPYDGFGRCGGEEFLAVLPGCDAATALRRAETLRARIAEQPIDVPDGPTLNVAASLGVAVIDDPTDVDADSAVRLADEALYEAKRNGRNRVELAPTSPSPSEGEGRDEGEIATGRTAPATSASPNSP